MTDTVLHEFTSHVSGKNAKIRNALVAAVLAAVLPAVLSGCSGTAGSKATPKPTATTMTVAGAITVPGFSKTGAEGEVCAAQPNFDDVASGGQVVVSDAAGKTIAIGKVGVGAFQVADVACEFAFVVSDVPSPGKFYGLHVGNGARGVVQFSKAEMQAHPELSITR
jgi:hypothetical protein